MDISTFIQNSLSSVWGILALSVLILVLGWFLARLAGKLMVRLLTRMHLVNFIARRLKHPDTERINRIIYLSTSGLVFLLVLWGVWKFLMGHPDISGFVAAARETILIFVQLPVVIFIFDLALIGLATFILFKAFGWVKTIFIIIARRIRAEKGRHLKELKIQQVKLFSEDQLTRSLLAFSSYARYAVDLLLILVYLTGVFSVFPQTRGFVTSLLRDILGSITGVWQNFVDYLPSLMNLILIIIITFYALKLIHFVFKEVEKGTLVFSGFYPEWALPTYQLVRIMVITLALIVAFPYLPGSSSPAFQGVTVFIGLLLSIGSSSVVANMISGVVLTYTRAFQIGDRVKIADTVGDVIEKGLFATRVRTIKNVDVTIPNGLVLGSHVINYSSVSKERGLIMNTTVTLGYDIPWRLIHETMINAALATDSILAEPRPFVLQTSLDDSYVSYEINAYTDQPNKMATIFSDLHQNIQDFCNQAGIEILSPQYGALRDGNHSTIPSEHLPKAYQTPSFNIRLNKDKE
jgi:small-conductance mechanosensitive channel